MPESTAEKRLYTFKFPEGELTCSSCTATVEKAIAGVKGVNPGSIKVSFITQSAAVEASCEPEPIIEAISAVGYTATLPVENKEESTSTPFDFTRNTNPKKYLWRSLVAAFFGIPLIILEILSFIPGPTLLMGQLILAGISLASAMVMLYSGWDIYKDAWRKGLKGITNMNTLVTLGSVLALAYSVLLIAAPMALPMLPGMHMSLCAGVLILAIVNFGSYLKERAQSKAIANLPAMRELYLHLQPLKANKVNKEGAERNEINFKAIKQGDYILVEAGHYFPVDGTIINADADIQVDERTLTGEKTARACTTGDKIQSGTLFKAESKNKTTIIQASCEGEKSSFHSLMSQIAQAIGGDSENSSINKFLKWFTPSVLVIAITAGLLWFFLAPIPTMGIGVFLAVLLCACPCALGLAAPIAYSTAVNTAFKHHIMIRNADAFDELTQVKTMAFDMTGTLTTGEMNLVKRSSAINDECLQLIASLEAHSQSTHPIAHAIRRANKLALLPVSGCLKDEQGRGISGIVNGHKLQIGALNWLIETGSTISSELKKEAQTEANQLKSETSLASNAFVAVDNHVIAYLLAEQQIREGAQETIAALKQQGIKTILLTGAQKEMAEMAKASLGMDEALAQQTPQSKKTYLEAFKHAVAFLGDDPNDFAGLSAKNVVGISIHPQAPAAGIAKINLAGSVKDLLKVIEIAKLTRQNIHLSLGFMVVYNLISIALAAGLFFLISGVILNPILASALMGASSLIVALNGMSLAYFIEKKFNPKLSLKKCLIDYWQNTSTLNKIIQISLTLFSLLLVSTLIANATLGFSWLVIFNSMILACTCCTGIVGILSAVGLIGLSLTVLLITTRAIYRQLSNNSHFNEPKGPSKKSLTDTAAGMSSERKPNPKHETGSTLKFFVNTPNRSLGVTPTGTCPSAALAP